MRSFQEIDPTQYAVLYTFFLGKLFIFFCRNWLAGKLLRDFIWSKYSSVLKWILVLNTSSIFRLLLQLLSLWTISTRFSAKGSFCGILGKEFGSLWKPISMLRRMRVSGSQTEVKKTFPRKCRRMHCSLLPGNRKAHFQARNFLVLQSNRLTFFFSSC